MIRRTIAAAALILAGTLLVACGDDDGGMSERAASRLQDQVAAIQYAAAGEAYGPAREGLEQLRATTARLVERGDLDPARAERILEEADRVDQVLAELTAG